MNASFTKMMIQCLPETNHTPHLLLKSSKGGVQLYTNYPCVTGISAEVCAVEFNLKIKQYSISLTAKAQGNFVIFSIGEAYLKTTMEAISKHFTHCPETLPDEHPSHYLRYVISVILEEYPTKQDCVPYTKQEQDLATLLFYMAERPESRQKRQTELMTRLTALQNNYILTKLHQDTKTLLCAACVMLHPCTLAKSDEGHLQ